MRKVLLTLLAALLMPAMAFAASNKAISKERGPLSNSTNGSNDNILYVDYTSLGWDQAETPAEGANFSVGLWFKTTAVTANDINAAVLMRLGTGNHNNNNGAIQLMQKTDGSLSVNLGGDNTGGTGTWSFNKSSNTGAQCGTASLNEWHFILLSFNSATTTLTAYLDGVKTAEETAPGVFGYKWADGVFAFGGYLWSGLIDEVQMYNAALTADEAEKAYNNQAKSIGSLTALYTLNNVKDGTTGQFESTVGTANPAVFENTVFANWWAGGLVNRSSSSETAATLVDGRVVDFTFTVPAASDYENVAELTFTADGVALTAGESVSLSASAEITINVTAAAGYEVASISVDGIAVENGGTFTLSGDLSKDNIVITLAQGAHALTVVNAENLPYTLTTAAGAEVDLANVLEGAELRLTLTVPEDKVLNTVKLGDEVLTANAQGAYLFTMPGEDATLTIDAAAKAKYTVTYAQPAGGTLSVTANGADVASGSQVLDGTVVTVTATANAGFGLVAVKANGAELTASTYTVNADVTFSAEFEEGINYCEPTPAAGRTNGSQTKYSNRGINSLEVSCAGKAISVQGLGTTGTRDVYVDRTSSVLEVVPGETVNIEAKGAGEWMQTYIFVDFDLNGFDSNDKVFDNWVSEQHDNFYAINTSFTVPADAVPGKYRVRYKLDWYEQTPCVYGQTSDNGDVVIDFLLQVPSNDYANARTITVAADNDLGTVAIINPATEGNTVETAQKSVTIEATPAEGASFINWTNAASEFVSESATYVYNGEEAAEFTAHFGYAVNVTVKGDGRATLSANGQTIVSGSVVAPGTEVTVNATPAAGKALISVVANNEAVATVGGVATLTADAALNIVVEFGEKQLSFSYSVEGKGTVLACTGMEEGEEEDEDGNYPYVPAGVEMTTGSAISSSSRVYFFIAPDADEEILSLIETQGGEENDMMGELESPEDGPYTMADGTPAYVYCPDFSDDYHLAIKFSDSSLGAIDSILSDSEAGEIEFFNLEGVRVAADNLTPGIYVVRHGSTTAKVLVK